MTDITIPPEALEAAYNARRNGDTLEDICLAMLNAWPGMAYDPGALVTDTYRDPGKIILPLPKEASDD